MELELIGGFFAILAALFSAIRFYFVRRATSPRGAMNTVMVSLIIGSLFFGPLSIILNYPNFELSRIGVLAFVLAGLLAASIFVSMYESVSRIGASRTSPITKGSLLIASLIGVLFLGESIEILHLIGIILLFFGVAMVSFGTSKKKSDSKSILSLDLGLPLLAMVLIGFASPVTSYGYSQDIPVTIGLAIQRITALVIVTGLFIYRGWNPLEPFRTHERRIYFGAAVAVNIYIACLFFALSIAPVVIVSPLRGTGPLFVLIISLFYLKRLEKITKMLVIGVIMTVLGAITVGAFL